MRRVVLVLVASAALVCSSLGVATSEVQASTPVVSATSSGATRVVVVYAEGASAQGRSRVRKRAGAVELRTLGRSRFELVKPAAGSSVAATLAALRADPRVVAAIPDVSLQVSSTPNDPLFDQQWSLHNTGQQVNGISGAAGADIHVTKAWDRTTGAPSVLVADLDTGYRFGHPDLASVAWHNPGEIPGNGLDDDSNGYVDDVRGWDFMQDDNDPTDPALYGASPPVELPVASHGVETAGTMAARGGNGVGGSGVAQNVRVLPVRVCGTDLVCPTSAIIAGINYAGLMHARAANLSLTGFFSDPAMELTFASAFADNPKTLYVNAAGNNATDGDTTDLPLPCGANPALDFGAVDNVLCVAATDQSDALAGFSTYGAVSVDLGAPGVDVLAPAITLENVYQTSFTGTAFDPWTTPVPPASAADQGFQHYLLTGGAEVIASDPPVPYVPDAPATQVPGTTRATQTPPISVPTSYQSCQISFIAGAHASGDDLMSWWVTVDGTKVVDEPVEDVDLASGFNRATFDLPAGSSAHELTFGYTFYRGLAGDPTPWAGVQSPSLDCWRGNYDFVNGTSFATPEVTGVAALLFSLKPTATVTQVRSAILKGADPIPALAGKTVTGGRLDAWKAMTALLPLDTRIVHGPSGRVSATAAKFTFDTNHTGHATGYQCRLDSHRYAKCSSPVRYSRLASGKHVFSVRAVLPGGVDTTPAVRHWKVTG